MNTNTDIKESSTIYIVDDDEAIRDSLSLSLSKRGYRVKSYSSSEEFLTTLQNLDEGCLILDISMPGISGIELQKILIEKKCLLPIIFITGHGDIEMSVNAIKDGAVDFIEKPFRHGKLLERIHEALIQNQNLLAAKEKRDVIESRFHNLTPREKEVMQILVSNSGGLTNKNIADKLDISHRTIDHHRARIMEKMHAKSLNDLLSMAESITALDSSNNN